MYAFVLTEMPRLFRYRSDLAGADIVEFILGEDEAENLQVRMRVRLTDPNPFVAENERVSQLWYGVVGVNREMATAAPNEVPTDVRQMSFSQEDVERFIPKDQRRKVLGEVCRAITELATHVRPPFIERATTAANPPIKALRKYFFTSEALSKAKYDLVVVGETDEGNIYWAHGRVDETS